MDKILYEILRCWKITGEKMGKYRWGNGGVGRRFETLDTRIREIHSMDKVVRLCYEKIELFERMLKDKTEMIEKLE